MPFDVGGVVLSSPAGTTLSVDSGGSQWMAVNANGILTRPQTPYFRGMIYGKATPYPGGAGGVLFLTPSVNIGGCWSEANGQWTCPVLGYYMVTGAGIASTQAGYLYIQRNGATYHYTHWNHTTTWHYVSLSGIVYCVAGDTIRYTLGGFTPATGVGFYGDQHHGMYSIALMA
jgi:hypothetical protein